MAVIESKVRKGYIKLKIGEEEQIDFSCQPNAIAFVPPAEPGGGGTDATEVLCGDPLPGDGTAEEWQLTFTAIQDFENKTGLINWSWTNHNKVADYEIKLSETAEIMTGKVTVRALPMGGQVNTRITSDATWKLDGMPKPKPAPGGAPVAPDAKGS